MAKKQDWYPTGRQNQLAFIQKWVSVFSEAADGAGKKQKWQVWGIPEQTFKSLVTAYGQAESALDAVILSGIREGPLHTAAQEKFAELEQQSRNLKRRYLFSPPLTAYDLDTLLLKQPDQKRSQRPAPRHTVSARVSNPDLHVVQLEMIPGAPGDEDLSYFTYNIRVGIFSPDGSIPERSETAKYYMTKVPVIPEDLPGQFTRKRRKESFTFTAADAGKTVYFAICYQNNKGETGPWSQIFSAIIT